MIALIAPWSFDISITVFIALALFAYLVYATRDATWRLRLTALLLALPALVGISLGLVNGSARDTMLGVGITVLLLVLQRVFTTPLSYRAARRMFRVGDTEKALELVSKSINARPDFWESYQLRALIHLSHLNLAQAERDAKKAVAVKPKAHPAYNTLGQIYLTEERFAAAEEAYTHALDLAPDLALYEYHLGLSQFRQGKYEEAAASFEAATQGTLPLDEYDLQASYYLGRSLEALGAQREAQTAYREMAIFRASLERLKRQLAEQPAYPHLARRREDVADIAQRLAQMPAAEKNATD